MAYWSIDAASAHYAMPDALPLTTEEAAAAASLRTRLNPFSPNEQRLLLRAGYSGADASCALAASRRTSRRPVSTSYREIFDHVLRFWCCVT